MSPPDDPFGSPPEHLAVLLEKLVSSGRYQSFVYHGGEVAGRVATDNASLGERKVVFSNGATHRVNIYLDDNNQLWVIDFSARWFDSDAPAPLVLSDPIWREWMVASASDRFGNEVTVLSTDDRLPLPEEVRVAAPAVENASKNRKIVVLGSTGYVGGRLVKELVAEGHDVRCVVRNPRRLDDIEWVDQVEIVQGDTFDVNSLREAFVGADIVYHLVHAMSDDGDFSKNDRASAVNVRDAAGQSNVSRIIYLGGLGDPEDPALSAHLSSRHEVGALLASGPVPVTELRAAVIIGSGSASFEMLRSLTEHLPVMVVPKWVTKTRCQPIAIRDVLFYLTAVLDFPATTGKIFDIGGGDVLTYREMMDSYAKVAGLRKRVVVPVPVLTPRLSSHWINFVTPLPIGLAKHLVDSLCNDVVVRPEHDIRRVIAHQVLDFDSGVKSAIARIQDKDIETSWFDALSTQAAVPHSNDPSWAGGTMFTDRREIYVSASPERVWDSISTVGGRKGWYGTAFLWQLRGVVDKFIGGVGMRRGRRHPTELRVGDVVDFFRVEDIRRGEFLSLRAEMKVPGYAWLQWSIEKNLGGGVKLTQTAVYVPRGLWGRIYWWSVVPFHGIIFPRMITRIAREAEGKSGSLSAKGRFPRV